jgi:hypothetical protein
MTDKRKVKFVNYVFIRKQVTSTYECSEKIDKLPDITNIPTTLPQNRPKLLINIFDSNNKNTDYTNIINNNKLINALFIYLSNAMNSGYAGGKYAGTALIGDYDGTFGIITGYYDSSKINNEKYIPGFQSLEDTTLFELCHRADNKTYSITPKQAIDYLLGQIYDLIQKNNYSHIVLPCELDTSAIEDDYRKYTLGSGIFNTHPKVKQYIYEKICSMTCASDNNGWQLLTDFLT